MKNNLTFKQDGYSMPSTALKELTSRVDRTLFQLLSFCFLLLSSQGLFVTSSYAYSNEVRASGTRYTWRTGDIDRGTETDLASAVNKSISQSSGAGREIHILVGGNLSATVVLPADVRVYFHDNTFTTTHTGVAVQARNVANVRVYDMKINASRNFYVFRFSGCNKAVLSGISINGGGIGMRLESSTARDVWNYTYYDLTVSNCYYENLTSHGLETYSVDRFNITGIIAKNNGECGVLLNNSRNGSIGTVDSYRCCYKGGYAGLRFANTCFNVTTESLVARECGRGLFVTSGSYDIHVKKAMVIDCIDTWGTGRGIWLEKTPDCSVESGCCNSGISNSGARSTVKVSTTCTVTDLPLDETLSEASWSVVVYPNPTTNEMTISLPYTSDDEKTVSLSDEVGNVVATHTFYNAKHTMHLQNLPAGTYILKMRDSQKLIVQKVIKQ